MFYLISYFASLTELNDFLKVLDKRADEQREKTKHHAAERKPRQEGCDALCDPPVNPPKWAVHKDWRKGVCPYYWGLCFNYQVLCSRR